MGKKSLYNKKRYDEEKHEGWLNLKKLKNEINQTSRTYEGSKRKSLYDRNSKSAKKRFKEEISE